MFNEKDKLLIRFENKLKNKDVDFESKLNASGIPHNFKFYNAEHAFANPSNPKHNVEATKDAYALTLEYLRTKFNEQ